MPVPANLRLFLAAVPALCALRSVAGLLRDLRGLPVRAAGIAGRGVPDRALHLGDRPAPRLD
ncbi:hypothetical protein GCM10009767_02420 [Kocuria aegyptia]|uniref:Uncharacterized protein n=1 Tax=Kocuria aegyptia TaxID=330943 RepID=A0ABP4W703_9MICC